MPCCLKEWFILNEKNLYFYSSNTIHFGNDIWNFTDMFWIEWRFLSRILIIFNADILQTREDWQQ